MSDFFKRRQLRAQGLLDPKAEKAKEDEKKAEAAKARKKEAAKRQQIRGGRSEKMRGIISALKPLYDAFLKGKTECRIKSPVCTGGAEYVHHTEGRGVKVVLDQSKWLECCAACNDYVENKDGEARLKGQKRSRHSKNQ